jgi:hypothetical protein
MKTFADLIFEPHAIARKGRKDCSPGAEIAKMHFEGKARISVIRGSERFQAGPGTYEVGISRPNFNLEIRGYQTPAQITEILKELQK